MGTSRHHCWYLVGDVWASETTCATREVAGGNHGIWYVGATTTSAFRGWCKQIFFVYRRSFRKNRKLQCLFAPPSKRVLGAWPGNVHACALVRGSPWAVSPRTCGINVCERRVYGSPRSPLSLTTILLDLPQRWCVLPRVARRSGTAARLARTAS